MDILEPDASSQYVGPGASYLSKLDSNSSLHYGHRTESTSTARNQYLTEMLLLEVEMPSDYHQQQQHSFVI